jgi:hypothetical protein
MVGTGHKLSLSGVGVHDNGNNVRTYKLAAVGSSGVVDEDVDSTEVSLNPLECLLNFGFIGDVTF